MFQQIGVPLVRDALSGYNTSVLSYGQVLNDAFLFFFFFFWS